MANETITFCCPACGIRLTVPAQLAGVTGPCPSCLAAIQAPAVSVQDGGGGAGSPAAEAPRIPMPAPLPVAAEGPNSSVLAAGPVAMRQMAEVPVNVGRPAEPAAEAAVVPLPVPEPRRIPEVVADGRAEGAGASGVAGGGPMPLKPEPRQLPQRTSVEPVAKQMPDPVVGERNSARHQGARSSAGGGRMARLVWPLIFVLATVAMIFGVMTYMSRQNRATNSGKRAESTVLPILPESPRPKTVEPATPKSDTRKATGILPPPPVMPDGSETSAPGKVAAEVLEAFLAAETLEARLPMMETRTPAKELAGSCLAGPLPRALSMLNEGQETNTIERVVDIYFNVDFELPTGGLNAQTVLVRLRGAAPPKVVADPFLDSFGGRLAKYAASPSDKAGVFQVIISAIASCNDENVPNREKKLTLKLLPRDNTKEIARAYFGRQSKIGMMLEDGTYSLSYGRAKACTVVLRWNTEDNEAHPYLEAMDLKTLDWNP